MYQTPLCFSGPRTPRYKILWKSRILIPGYTLERHRNVPLLDKTFISYQCRTGADPVAGRGGGQIID